ncbi:ATP-binding protein [Leifsonia poae]|uniref:ATP-binding protein n=1 Tax=Leifsonia poae TaxID=110933 RepID=UPI003D687462
MQPSPYTPGVIARATPGRAQQLADFDERLSYLVDLHRLNGRIRVDYAPRGYGKTSLLRQYERHARDRGVLTVWVTAGEGDLIAQIASAVERATVSWREDARRRIQDHLKELTFRAGIPAVLGVEATLRSEASSPPPFGSRAFEDVVREAAAADDAAGLIILVDEIQAADSDGLRTLAYAWQHLQAEGADVPAAVFAAGLPNAPDMIGAAVTFSERFAYRPLPPLSPADEELALALPARQLGVEWDRDAVAHALAIARGYPYLVQLVGDAAWTAAGRPDAGGRITAADVTAGQRAVDEDLAALYRSRWSNASPKERVMMAAMAGLGDGPVLRKAIAEAMGADSRALSPIRARLLDKGLVQPSGHGALEFTIPGFAAFVRANATE